MPPLQKVFNVGDLVRWKALVKSPRPAEIVRKVEGLGIVRKLIGCGTLELKVISADDGCTEYLNALRDLNTWQRLPVHTNDCEIVA